MLIEMDDRLAATIVEVQDVCQKHGLDIMDLPCGVMWMEFVGIAIGKITGDPCPRFNYRGCQGGQFPGQGKPNTSGITKP